MIEGKEVRDVAKDPLGQRKPGIERRLALSPVRGPRAPNLSGVGKEQAAFSKAAGALGNAVQGFMDKRADDQFLQGQLLAQQGKTLEEIGGNMHTQAGFQAFGIRNDVNRWYADMAARTTNELAGESIDVYRETVAGEFKALTDSIKDPRVRKMAVQMGNTMLPRLGAMHVQTQNDFNRQQTLLQYKDLIKSNGTTADDNSMTSDLITNKDTPNGPVRSTAIPHTPTDVDALVRTIYGEAGSESVEGKSAVAHVIINRIRDKRWGNSAYAVAREPQQFSTWNLGAGGNKLARSLSSSSPIYKRIEKIAKAALTGQSEDPTGGATHYYSPKGMEALVNSGSQKNLIPGWLAEESKRSSGTLKIGGHIFAGRSSGVARPAGGEGEGSDTGAIGNSTKELIMKYDGLSKADRAQAVTEAMIETLDDGDERVFADGGGLGVLSQIGATRAQISAVRAAKKRFDVRQQNKYDGDMQKRVHDVITRAGKTGDGDAARVELEALAKEHQKSDRWLTSVVDHALRASSSTSEAANDPLLDPENRQALQETYTDVRDGKLTAKEANDLVIERAEEMGLSPQQIKTQLRRMETAETALLNRRRSQAEQAAAKAQKQLAKKERATKAVAAGDVSHLTAEEKRMAVDFIKEDVINTVNSNGELPPQQRAAEMLRMTQSAYARLGLVDEQLKSSIRAGITVPVDSKGNVTDGALDAYETFVTLKHIPGLPQSYVNSLVTQESRALMETAITMDAGNLNSNEAIGKAHTQMSQELSPEFRDIKLGREGTRVVNQAIDEFIDKVDTNTWDWLIGSAETGDSEVTDEQIERVRRSSRLKSFVGGRVAAHLAAHPNLDRDVAIKMAVDDLDGRAVFMGGSVIFGREGRQVKDDMGLQSFGTTNVEHAAMTSFLEANGANDDMWGDKYSPGSEYHVEYDPSAQVFTVDLLIDPRSMTDRALQALETLNPFLLLLDGAGDVTRVLAGQPKRFKASTIGDAYKKTYTPDNQ